MKKIVVVLVVFAISLVASAQTEKKANSKQLPTLPQLQKMMSRYAPTELKVDTSGLSAGDRKAIAKLIEASRIVDQIQLEQRWNNNEALYNKLKKEASPLGKARAHYFWINKGPWSILDENEPFVAGVPERKPLGANFYPEDATKEELEAWMKSLPEDQRKEAEGFFTVIRRDEAKKLKIVPYSQEYKDRLAKMSQLLHEAAELTSNASLKKFLNLRADAFTSNDYFDSDVAWMDLNSPVDVTIGPYETYNDELFGYKAAFEAYVNVRDEKETQKLAFFGKHLQDIENNLPIPQENRNPKIGAMSPIAVVNEVFGAGDGNMGVQTAAYNLPNDERVIQQKGSKRVMLKNVQQSKFNKTLIPISKVVLSKDAQADLDFESFFTHILAHELTHGLGPHVITLNGKQTNPRQQLKEQYSAIEEAKADVTGLFAVQFLMSKGLLKDSLGQGDVAERKLYNTFLASAFRTLRFGTKDAHARGMAMQFNFLVDHGGFVVHPDGTFSVDFSKIQQAVKDLDNKLLMLEATGDYAGAKKTLAELSVVRPEVQRALDKLKSVPTDIEPQFVTANLIAPAARMASTVTKVKK
ncbi:MAG: hypothetical protein JWO13_1490 [Acidobacteriales bacterium]|nr:hypothetical protein [Terriglobales bacterium]